MKPVYKEFLESQVLELTTRIKNLEERSTCQNRFTERPILYTDTIKGKQVCRDDLWAVSSEELNIEVEIINSKDKEIESLQQKILELENKNPEPLKIVTENEKSYFVRIGDKIFDDNINYDLYGWSGMQGILDIIEFICESYSIPTQHIEIEEDDN